MATTKTIERSRDESKKDLILEVQGSTYSEALRSALKIPLQNTKIT